MARKSSVVPILGDSSSKFKTAERSELINYHKHYKSMTNEWLRRQILVNNRVDILATHILGYDVMPHHFAMMKFQFTHSESLQLAFRGAGKSTVCTVTKAIHYLLKNPNFRILIPSKSMSNSQGFLKEIKGHFESNEKLAEIFGTYYDPRRVAKWNDTEIEVVPRTKNFKEASVTCVSVEGTIVSKHYDAILSDDLIDEDNARTQYIRDKVKTWYYQTLEPTLEPPDSEVEHRGEHHRMGTRYHYADLYGHLIESELSEKHQVIPALKNGMSPWPDKYQPEWFEEKRKKSGVIIFNCHSEDTEFLTQGGWKLFDDVLNDDKLMTFSIEREELELQGFKARIENEKEHREMLWLKNRGVDALVTPDHRMIARPLVGKSDAKKPWSMLPASELNKAKSSRTYRTSLPCGGKWNGKEKDSFLIPCGDPKRKTKLDHGERVVNMDSFLRFLGFFVSEGATSKDVRGSISFSQNIGPVADEIVSVIQDIGFEPNVNTYENEFNKYWVISFSHIGLWTWLRGSCGTNSGSVRLPRFVFELSSRQQKLLINSAVDGDGTINEKGSDGSFWYTTTSKQLDDDLCELSLRVGFNWHSRLAKSKVEGHADVWRSYSYKTSSQGLLPDSQIKKIKYNGRTVCFTVPNDTLVTRRNGRVVISGNCQYQCDTEAMKGEIFQYDDCQRIKNSDIPDDLRIFMGIDLAISEDAKADHFAIAVLGIDSSKRYYVLDWYDGQLRFGQQTKKIIQFYKRWKPIRACIETNGYQKAQYQSLKDEDEDIRLIPKHQDKDKIARAWKMSSIFEDKRMFFKQTGGVDLVIEQLVLFPNHRYKDFFDALDLALTASKMKKRKRRREEPGLF